MDEKVKKIPPDAQPSDAGGLIEMKNAPNGGNDNVALFLFGTLLVIVAGVVIWGTAILAPPVQEWIDNKINPEPTISVPISGIACYEDCPDAICPELESLECPVLVCPGCDPCPTVPDDQITDNREGIGDYLIDADEVLTDMEASIALLEEVSRLMWSFGDTRSSQTSAFNDAQWNRVLEDADNKVKVVQYNLSQIWPPGPYNSCNPLLDAHARMLLAFVNIDEARDDMLEALNERSVDKMAYFYTAHVKDARNNIDLARLQLAKVR